MATDIVGRAKIIVDAAIDDKGFQSQGRAIRDVGLGLTAGITAPLVALGASSVRVSTQFSQSMNVLQAATSASDKQMAALNQQATELGAKTVFSANEAASAMVELGKAGQSTEQIMATVPQVMNLAATEGLALADAAGTVTSALAQFQLAPEQAGQVVNALAGAANASRASVDSLSASLSLVGATANSMGFSVQETAGALAALAQSGLEGSIAGTSLNAVFARLVPTTAKAAAEMARLGLDFTNADGSFKSVAQIAGTLQSTFGGMSQEAQKASLAKIFGSDASTMAAVNALVNTGAAGIREYTKAATDQGAAQKLADARMKGLAGALERLSGAFETAQKAIGDALAPAIRVVADSLGFLLGLFVKMPKSLQTVVVVFGVIAAAVGPVILAIGALVASISTIAAAFASGGILAGIGGTIAAIAGPVLLVVGIIAAIGAALVLLWKHNETFRNAVMATWNAIRTAASAVAAWFTGTLVPVLAAVWEGIKVGVSALATVFTTVWNVIKVTFTALWTALVAVWDAVGMPIFTLIEIQIKIWVVAIETIIGVLIIVFKAVWDAVAAVWKTVGVPLFELIKAYIGAWVAVLSAIWGALKVTFKTVWDAVSAVWNSVGAPVFVRIKAALETFKTGVGRIVDAVKGFFSGMWDGLVAGGKEAVNGAIALMNGLIKGINLLIDGANAVKVGGSIPSVKPIPLLAGGTRNFSGGFAIVGEQGPELVTMPRHSKVSTASETRALAASRGDLKVVVNNYGPTTGSMVRRQVDWADKYGTRFGAATAAGGI